MNKRTAAGRWVMAVFTAQCMVGQSMVWAAVQVVPDGRTQTRVQQSGAVTDVRTGTVRGVNGYNSFSHFNVDAGNTVNLHLPSGTQNLVNLVHDSRTDIHGVLNSIKDGAVGGNVYIANPHGIVVGKTGTVNVGSLNLSTPTPEAMDRVLDGAGNPVDAASAALMANELPINADASIRIGGKVNAKGDVRVHAGDVSVAGRINALPAPAAGAAVVNTEGLESGTAMVEQGGEIWILAEGDATVRGELRADGGTGGDGGTVQVLAGGDIEVDGDAKLTARAGGAEASGGKVVVYADQRARLADDATLDTGGGKGGFVEFSATDTVELAGGHLAAGEGGKVLIDPANLSVGADILRDDTPGAGGGVTWSGSNLALDASDSITVESGVVISTRKVTATGGQTARDAHINNGSTGDSGSLTITAPSIAMKSGSMLLAHATGPFSAGDITLNADVSVTDVQDPSTPSALLGTLLSGVLKVDAPPAFKTFVDGLLEAPQTRIDLDGATLKGQDIHLTATGSDRLGFDKQATARIDVRNSRLEGRDILIKAIADTSLLPAMSDPSGAMDMEDLLDFVNPFDATPFVSLSTAQAKVSIDNSALIATRDISAEAIATSKAKSLTTFYLAAVGYGYSDAEATVEVTGNSLLDATKALKLSAHTQNIVAVSVDSSATNLPIAAAYAQTDTYSKTRVVTGDNVTLRADSANLAAQTDLDITTQSTATERGSSSAAIAIALANLETLTEALLGGKVTVADALNVTANHDVEQNILNASATSNGSTSSFSTKLNNKVAGLQRQAAGAVLGQFTGKGATIAGFLFPGIKSGKLNMGATLALADTDNTVRAAIQPNATVRVGGLANVKAKLSDDFNLGAVTLAKSDGVGLGGAVAIGDYNNTVEAFIGDAANVDVNGLLTVQADTELAYPWSISWDNLEDVLNHLTGGLNNFLFTTYAFNDSKGKSFSLAAAVDIIDMDNSARAWIGENARVNQAGGAGALSVLAANDINFVQAAGAKVPFPLINRLLGKNPSSNGLGGAAGFIDISADAMAWIDDGARVDATSLTLNAQTRERLIQLNKAGAKVDNLGVAGTLALTKLRGTAAAGIEAGAVVDVSGVIDIDAKTDANALLIAGAVLSGGNAGVGMSISMLTVDTDTDAFIDDRDGDAKTGGNVSAGQVNLDALDDSDIHSFSAAAAVTTGSRGSGGADAARGKGKYGLGFSGDVSLNDIVADVRARVGGHADLDVAGLHLGAQRNSNIVSLSGTVAYASGGTQSAGLAGAYAENDSRGETLAVIEAATVDASGDIELKADNTGRVFALAAGGAGVPSSSGISIAGQVTNNFGTTQTRASVINATINGAGASAGKLDVLATDDTAYRSVAGAVALGGKAGVGAGVSLNHLANQVQADIRASDVRGPGGVTVMADTRSTIESAAAAIVASSNFALSGGVSLNEIANTTRAFIDNTGLPALDFNDSGDLTVKAGNASTIRTLAGGVSASGKAALGASVAINEIGDLTEASASGLQFRGETRDLTIEAGNGATIESIAGSINASSSVGAGAAVAVNRIANTTRAFVAGGINRLHVRNLIVRSVSASRVDTISVALGASGAVGFGGSASVNHMANQTEAYLGSGVFVDAEHNIGVLAQSDDRIGMAAGAAGIGARAAGVGLTLGINEIGGHTRAWVDGTGGEINAYANDATDMLAVNDGGLSAGVDLGSQVELASYHDLDLKTARTTTELTGLAVNASSSQHVGSIGVNIAAGSVAAGLIENINVISGDTTAYIRDGDINSASSVAGAGQRVDVRATNIAYGNSFVGNVAGGGAAVGVGADLHSINRATWAYTSGGRISARDRVAVTARALQGLSSLAVGGSVGGTAAAGTLIMGQFDSNTQAWVDATRIDTGDLAVVADSDNDMYLLGGTVAGGGSAVGGTVVISRSDSVTRASLRNTTGLNRLVTSGQVEVVADNQTTINHIAVSGAVAGGYGLAGMASVSLLTDTTEASVSDAELGSTGRRIAGLNLKASHAATIDTKAGALGGGAVGAGAGASVNIVKARTLATLEDSKVDSAGLVTVAAVSRKSIDALAMAGGAGLSGGIGGAAVVNLIGSNVRDEAAAEVDQGTLAGVDSFARDDRGSGLSGEDDVLSASERSSLNAATQTEVASVARGTDATGYQHRTEAAIVGTSQVISTGPMTVEAKDKLRAKTVVGGFGISAGLGAGAGVGVTQVAAHVAARIASGVTVIAGNQLRVAASAENLSGDAVDILALNGAAGLVGLGAAVAVGDLDNTVDAELGGVVAAGTASINVIASDTSSMNLDAYGAAAGAVGAGAVVATGKKRSTVLGRTGIGADISGGTLAINAISSGRLKARTLGAAAGVGVALNGSAATVEDNAVVSAWTGDNSLYNLSGQLAVQASATPDADANAEGYAAAGGYQVGVSYAQANVNNVVTAMTGTGTRVDQASGIRITADQLRTGDTAKARAVAAGGALVGSANATRAEATNNTRVQTHVGINSQLTSSGGLVMRAKTDNLQNADVTGISLALGAALGSNNALASYNTTQLAGVASGARLHVTSLNIQALGEDRNDAATISGGGALVAALGAAKATTSGTSLTRIYLETGAAGGKQTIDNVALRADHLAEFDAFADSTNAGLVGMSGAAARNDNRADVVVDLAANLNLEAGNLDVVAHNRMRKDNPGRKQVVSKSGGLYDGPAATSYSTYTVDTRIKVGTDTQLAVVGDPNAPGAFNLAASNDLFARDTVKVDSGGAIANAKGASRITGNLTAAIDVGERASLYSVGDINLTTRSDADIKANAFVDTYGLAGAGQGESVATATDVQDLTIGADAAITATGELNLLAGADLTGLGILRPEAQTRVFNKTAFAYTGTPIADALANRTARVTIKSGAKVASGRHMTVQAAKDHLLAFGSGKATDASREALEAIAEAFGGSKNALEVQGGSSTNTGSGGIVVDGELRTGIYNKLALTFGLDFNPYYLTAGGTKGKYVVGQAPGAEQWSLFDDAGNKVADLNPTEQTEGIDWTILTDRRLSDTISAEIARLQDLKLRYGGAANPQVDSDLATRISILQTQLSSRNTQEYVDVIQVSPAVAATGNINLWADYVVGASGKINAPGDAAIDIISESPMPLQLASLTIPDERGGLVKFNNELVHSGADIQARNSLFAPGSAGSLTVIDATSSPDPHIIVESRYSHLSRVSNPTDIPNMYDPDLLVTGTVSNINGLVKLDNRWGSIVATAAVRGGDVDISAGGDFFFDGGETLYNIGPHPMSDQGFGRTALMYENGPDSTGSRATVEQASEKGRQLFGNNIYITADTININGVIQSGIPDKNISISQAEVDAAMATPGDALYVPIKYVDETLAGNIWNGDDRRGQGGLYAELDRTPGDENIRIIGTEVQGGTVLLSGRIVSTGKGKVNVIDGFGRIAINNASTLPVSLMGVDTGGIEGQIILIDKARTNGRGLDRVTRYARIGNEVRVYDNWALDSADATRLIGSSSGRDATYTPVANMRYYWMTGESESSQVEKKWYKENNSFLGFIPSDKRSFSDSNYVAGYPKTRVLTGAELPAGDYVAARAEADDYTYRREVYTTKNERISQQDTDGTNWYWGGFCDCIPKKKTWWRRTEIWDTGKNIYNYHSVRADHTINIGFVGYDSGRVVVNSVGGINIAGQFNNVDGYTGLFTSQGDIRSASLTGIRSGNLNMSASNGSVGEVGNYLRLHQKAGDQVFVDAGHDIYLESPAGDLRVTRLVAGAGNIGLIASQDLLVNSVTGVIKGKSVRLESRTGSIGSGSAKVRVDTDAAAGGDLVVKAAKGDIVLEEVSGDLRIKEIVTLNGDLDLTVDGNVLDGNTEAVRDETAITQLEALWSDLGLTGTAADEKQQQQITTYEQEQEALYQSYWRNERNLTVDADGKVSTSAYDPTVSFHFSTAEAEALRSSGWSDDQIAQREAFVTDRYRGFGASAYDAGFSYTATIGEVADLTGGYSWSNEQLKNTLPSFVFKPTTDTTTRIENPNIQARNVKVTAGGQIGVEINDTTLALDGSNTLTPEILTALAAAERDDVTLTDTTLTIRQKEDLDIHASGTIELNAKGHIFLGAEQDVNVYAATSDQDIRVKVAGSINNARSDDQAVFRADNLLLEAAGGHIGSLLNPMRVDQRAAGALVARAEQGIFIDELSGDMHVDSVFSEQQVQLHSAGNMTDWSADDALNIQAPVIALSAGGDIGTGNDRAGALEIKVDDATGRLTLTSATGGANVFSPEGVLPLGEVALGGDLRAESASDIDTHDLVITGGSVALVAGRDINLLAATSAGADATAVAQGTITTKATTAVAGSLVLKGASIDLVDVAVGNDMSLTATGGGITGRSTISVTGLLSAQASGDIDLLAPTSAGGKVSMGAAGIHFYQLSSDSDVVLLARSGDIRGAGTGIQLVGEQLTLTSLTGSVGLASSLLMGDSNGKVNLAANDGVYYHERVGDLSSDSITTIDGSMNLLVAGNAELGKLTAPDTVRVEVFGDALTIDDIDPRQVILIVHGEGGSLGVTRMTVSEFLGVQADNVSLAEVFNPGSGDLHLALAGNDGGMADTISLATTGGGRVIFDTFKARNFDLTFGSDDVALYGMEVGERGFVNSPTHRIVIDNVNRRLYEEATGQLNSNFKPFDLVLHPERLFDTSALLVNYSPLYIANLFSTENSLTRLEVKRDTLPELTSLQLAEETSLVEVMVVADNLTSFLTTAGGAAVNDDEVETWFLNLEQAQADSDIQVIQ